MYQLLKAHGYANKKPIEHKAFGIYHFFITDDQDLTVEFQVFL
jgi:hypothetical protein